jgi:uncharacterized Zn finger protein (UPF0148 family)
MADLCKHCGHPLPNSTGTYCPKCGEPIKRWAVVAIDWGEPNVLVWSESEANAKEIANGYDKLALRAVAVPEGHPLIRGGLAV